VTCSTVQHRFKHAGLVVSMVSYFPYFSHYWLELDK